MRPTLYLHPIHGSSTAILRSFFDGKPLSSDQLNFLDWHQHELSNACYDPILNYYLSSRHHKTHQFHGTFLLPHEEMNLEAIQSLKQRILASLSQKHKSVVFTLTQKQFLEFKTYTINELIFWHGNQFLTGAPFFPGGIPPVIYFQWGNLFGVVKYVVLPSEKTLKANLLVYFEDMEERDLDQCVHEYQNQMEKNINLQNEIAQQHTITPKPTLMPSHYFLVHHY